MNDTREKLLTAAARLFGRQGFAATGLKELAKEADAPWGSIYHFFPGGKTQIALEAILRSADWHSSLVEGAFADHARPIDAIASIIETFSGWLRRTNYSGGCPGAAIALEVGTTEDLRKQCRDAFDQITDSYTVALMSAGVPEDVAPAVAGHILASINGAIMLCRASMSTTPLEQTLDSLRLVLDGHFASVQRYPALKTSA